MLACECWPTLTAIDTNADSSGAHRLYIYIERERGVFFLYCGFVRFFPLFFYLFLLFNPSTFCLWLLVKDTHIHLPSFFFFFLRSRWLSTVFSAFDLFVHSFFFFRQLFPFSSSKYSRECLKKKKNVLLIFFFAAATCDCVSSLCYFREEKRATKIRRPHADDFLLSVLRQWY